MNEKDLYIKELENTLMNALDVLYKYYNMNAEHYDYYDILSSLSNWTNSDVLNFLDKFGDDVDEE